MQRTQAEDEHLDNTDLYQADPDDYKI